MRVFLTMKLYASVGLAVMGVLLAFRTLEFIELVQFFSLAILFSLLGTGLHFLFENLKTRTNKDYIGSPNIIAAIIVMTVIIAGGVFILLSFILEYEFSNLIQILVYSLFIPAIILVSLWLMTKFQEEEYNKRLQEKKQLHM